MPGAELDRLLLGAVATAMIKTPWPVSLPPWKAPRLRLCKWLGRGGPNRGRNLPSASTCSELTMTAASRAVCAKPSVSRPGVVIFKGTSELQAFAGPGLG